MGKLTISNFGLVLPPNYIDGLILSNGTDTEHDIDISTGFCTPPDEMLAIQLSSILTKQIDVDWAEGDDDGGFPSGLSIAADTWYHIFVISNDDGSLIDAGFDSAITASNLLADATGYTKYRRIGSVLTDASSNITQFFQYANGLFYWKNPPLDVNGAAISNAGVTATLSTPLGVHCEAILNTKINRSGGAIIYMYPTDVDIEAASLTAAPLGMVGDGTGTNDVGWFRIITNLTSQIGASTDGASGYTYSISLLGFKDFRGKE